MAGEQIDGDGGNKWRIMWHKLAGTVLATQIFRSPSSEASKELKNGSRGHSLAGRDRLSSPRNLLIDFAAAS